MDQKHHEALARVIDPVAWSLADDKRMERHLTAQRQITAESMATAAQIIDSGLMASLEWDRHEYITAKNRIIEATSRSGRCESHEDGLDGYFKHDPRCPHWPDSAIGGSTCDSWH